MGIKKIIWLALLLFPLMANASLFYPDTTILINRISGGTTDINGGNYWFKYLGVNHLDVNFLHANDINITDINVAGDANYVNIGVSQNAFLTNVNVAKDLNITGNVYIGESYYNDPFVGGNADMNATNNSVVIRYLESLYEDPWISTIQSMQADKGSIAFGSQYLDSKIIAKDASLAFGNTKSICIGCNPNIVAIKAIGNGSFASGFVSGNFNYGTHMPNITIESNNEGSFAWGYLYKPNIPPTSTQNAEEHNSILSSGKGSVAMGYNYDGNIVSSGSGSIAMGYADQNLMATGSGAIALGYNCQSLNTASVCLGKDLTNYNANSVLVQDLNAMQDINAKRAISAPIYFGDGSKLTGISSSGDANHTASTVVPQNAFLNNVNVTKDLNCSANVKIVGDINANKIGATNNIYTDKNVTANTFIGNGTIPLGGIIMWSGNIASIPTCWAFCDGTKGTPNLTNKFVIGAEADQSGIAKARPYSVWLQTGGYNTHNHSFSATGTGYAIDTFLAAYGTGAPNDEFTWLTEYDDVQVTVSGTTNLGGNIPPFFALAYIMRIC